MSSSFPGSRRASLPRRWRRTSRRPSSLAATAVAAVVVAGLVATSMPPAAADVAATDPDAPVHRAPVNAEVVDRFRPPVTPYSAGNRGIDYATVPGQEVRTSAEGEVTFAGRIGPSHHVVVLHPDGLRTSYSFLSGVTVDEGQRVGPGAVVGTAGAVLHFGVRAGERYLDPEALLAGGPVEVHLVPVELRRPQGSAQERRWLVELVGEAVGAAWRGIGTGAELAGGALAWASDAAAVAAAEARSLAERAAATGWESLRAEVEARWAQAVVLATYVGQLPISPLFAFHVAEQWERAERFRAAQAGCTPASAPPPPASGRRIAVLVAGFGSSSEGAEVLEVDSEALGYAPGDVAQFSYAGGRTPGTGSLAGPAVSEYGPAESAGDLELAGQRLGELIDAVAVAHPGVPIDVLAHSQGGLVARLALAEDRPVSNLVTLGTPHHGADLATANLLFGTTGPGELTQSVALEATGGTLDGASTAAEQLSETSALIDELDDRALPSRTRVTSIAARGDLTVAGLQSSLDGATNVMVPLEGISAHADLPGSPLAQRELALALAGRGPTCRALGQDLALAGGISLVEDGLGLATGLGAMWLDRQVPTPAGAFRGRRLPPDLPPDRSPPARVPAATGGR